MKFINPKYEGVNNGHYTPGIIAGGMLYISGQLSICPDTRKVPEGGIKEHAMLAFKNLDRVLCEADVARNKVVKCNVYLSDINDWDEVNGLYSDFFGEHKPARIVVPAGKLHFGCLIEIDAIAEV